MKSAIWKLAAHYPKLAKAKSNTTAYELLLRFFNYTERTKFLLELGKGFAFVGRQYPIEIGKKSYSLDLLFYHINLKCYIVIELKTVESFTDVHTAQVLTYLKLGKFPLGLLINFHSKILKNNIKRFINT
mgnify:CR=1 FL=1